MVRRVLSHRAASPAGAGGAAAVQAPLSRWRGDPPDREAWRRRLHGQHATGHDVADLIAAFCIRSASDRVLDPSCGAGDFLLRAARRLSALGASAPSLTGVEIDAEPAQAARERLPGAEILSADFLALTTPTAPFDAVVGNPPYVRQELVPAERKRELAALSGLPGRPRLGGRCDLHAWFWAPAIGCLRAGGRLGWVVSAAWLDAAYGATLRGWLAREVSVVAVIESEVESWFDAARVRTAVVIIQKTPPGASHTVRFIRLGRRLDELAPPDLDETRRAERFAELAATLESAGARGATRGRGEAGSRVTRAGTSPRRGESFSVRNVAGRRLGAEPWGPLLRATDLCLDLIARAGDRLVPLETIATVRWGIKTGDDAVFFPTREDAAAASLESAVLRPGVFSLMEMDRLVVSPRRLRRRLLVVDTRVAAHRALLTRPASGLATWLARAREARGTHRRPTIAAREQPRTERRWFEMRPGAPGAILWSIMHQYRHLAPINQHGVAANDNLLLVDPRPGVEPRLLAALLNSHVQALLKHAAGRQRNEGMLKTQAGDVRRMLVPDPRRLTPRQAAGIVRCFDALARRRIGTVTEEVDRLDRRRLDVAVLGALGMPPGECASLGASLAADLQGLHARERRWESDAIRRRRRGPRRRPSQPAGVTPPAGAPG